MKRAATVILANGAFPRSGSEGWRLLDNAKRIVACDGAADICYRRLGRRPDVAIGDLDSLKSVKSALTVVKVDDQETNDLRKAIDFCAERGWKDPVVVGAFGKREDHSIGNVFLALDHEVEIIADHGRFVPVHGRLSLTLPPGTPVSIFAPDPETRMRSKGLKWPLDGVRFSGLYRATLNRTDRRRVCIESDRRALVYLAFAGRPHPEGSR